MHRLITFIFFSFFVFSTKGQVDNFNSQPLIGEKITIKALPYTNDINKYYFNKTSIQKLAIHLKENPSTYIEINCFSDFSDSPMMNLMATADQAVDIKSYLIELGIEGSRIETVGNGDMFPIFDEDKLENMTGQNRITAELENRRIEIVILKK